MIKKYGRYFAGVITLLFLASFSAFADVKVSAEGTYDDDNLIVNIYADTTFDTIYGAAVPIVSYGVKMFYDVGIFETDPEPVVTKNDTDWYFGTQAVHFQTDNANPDTSTDGIVVIVGGKIDQDDPMAGVSGEKVLLASVTLVRIPGTSAPTNLSVSLELGKGGDYANFVTLEPEPINNVLDGTNRLEFLAAVINPECVLVGDLNGDNIVNMLDIYVVQANWGQTGDNIADMNDDDIVNMSDIYIIQANWGNLCP